MKIFADTNILVSAFTARGLCADLLEVILADHHLMTGEFVLRELHRVLVEKLKVPESKVSDVLQFLRKYHSLRLFRHEVFGNCFMSKSGL